MKRLALSPASLPLRLPWPWLKPPPGFPTRCTVKSISRPASEPLQRSRALWQHRWPDRSNEIDISKSTVNVTIDMNTVDTGVAPRDADLKSDHFFDVAKFPTATFVSTSVARNGNGLTVNGNLTLHGVTKPVVLEVEGPTGPISGMDHKQHEGFSATTTISRIAFGIGANYPASVVGDDVKLNIDLDVVKQ